MSLCDCGWRCDFLRKLPFFFFGLAVVDGVVAAVASLLVLVPSLPPFLLDRRRGVNGDDSKFIPGDNEPDFTFLFVSDGVPGGTAI